MDTIFVTGGTGFLGRHLVPALLNADYHVRLLVRNPAQHTWLQRYSQIEIVHGDIQDAALVARGAQGARSIIHAAGMFRFWGQEAEFDHVNVGGAENVIRACIDAGCERLIHISSVYLIGQPPRDQVIDETYPAHPVEPYQRSKLKAEQLMLRAHAERGVPVVVLRPGAFYGPYGEYAFNRLFFRDPMRGIIMQLNGGRYIILPVFVPDVAQGALLALTRGRAGEIYNICDDPIAHRDAYDIVTQEAKLWFPRLTLPDWVGLAASHLLEAVAQVTRVEPFYPLNLRSYVYNYWRVSHDKAARELGFAPTPFREGARQTIAWYKAGKPRDKR